MVVGMGDRDHLPRVGGRTPAGSPPCPTEAWASQHGLPGPPSLLRCLTSLGSNAEVARTVTGPGGGGLQGARIDALLIDDAVRGAPVDRPRNGGEGGTRDGGGRASPARSLRPSPSLGKMVQVKPETVAAPGRRGSGGRARGGFV